MRKKITREACTINIVHLSKNCIVNLKSPYNINLFFFRLFFASVAYGKKQSKSYSYRLFFSLVSGQRKSTFPILINTKFLHDDDIYHIIYDFFDLKN